MNEEHVETRLSARARYQLEAQRIRQEIGDLPQILKALGLNQRRVCQLLLVDPSAWTRWNKTGAPPHIYQSLSWLLQLKRANPAVTGPIDLGQRLDKIQMNIQAQIKDLEHGLAMVERALALTPAASETSGATGGYPLALLNERSENLRVIAKLEAKVHKLTAAQSKKMRRTRKAKRPVRKSKAAQQSGVKKTKKTVLKGQRRSKGLKARNSKLKRPVLNSQRRAKKRHPQTKRR